MGGKEIGVTVLLYLGGFCVLVSRRRRDPGEMPELAEGARLEIVCSVNRGTVGSNPTLSARKFAEQILPLTRDYKNTKDEVISFCVGSLA